MYNISALFYYIIGLYESHAMHIYYIIGCNRKNWCENSFVVAGFVEFYVWYWNEKLNEKQKQYYETEFLEISSRKSFW